MTASSRRAIVVMLAAGPAALATIGSALAAGGPFGVGTPDAPTGTGVTGPFGGIVLWSMHWQTVFYGRLTDALSTFSESPHAAEWLIALSFAYGIFHAIGPGHGKAVIASYLLASGESRRRGVLLSAAAGLVQAASAIALVSIATVVFNITATAMTQMTDAIAIVSYGLIALIGLGLLLSAMRALRPARRQPVASASGFTCVEVTPGDAAGSSPAGPFGRHGAGCMCAAAAVTLVDAPAPPRWPQMIAICLSIGIRPCSGALIVLVFALSQGLYPAGLLSVLAMSAGTAATVGLVALTATAAHGVLMRLDARSGRYARPLSFMLRSAAALVVLTFGLVMMTGALAADGLI